MVIVKRNTLEKLVAEYYKKILERYKNDDGSIKCLELDTGNLLEQIYGLLQDLSQCYLVVLKAFESYEDIAVIQRGHNCLMKKN